MIARSEQKIYVDFLTNLAVAWFSAGVIAPFISPVGVDKLLTPLAAGMTSWISLQLAIYVQRGGK